MHYKQELRHAWFLVAMTVVVAATRAVVAVLILFVR